MTKLSIRLRALIPEMESSRKTHSEWGDYLTANPGYSATTADLGNKEHHDEQVSVCIERIATIKEAVTALEEPTIRCGPHFHVASNNHDICGLCGEDLRHEIHKRGRQ